MRGVCIFLGYIFVAQAVDAGPWTQDDGASYARLDVSRVELESLQAWRSDAYGEYGLSKAWTLTAKAESVRYDDAADFNSSSWRATLRRKLYTRGRFLISAEGGMVYVSTPSIVGGCRDFGSEVGLSTGMSGVFKDLKWFAALDAAHRQYEGDCQTQKLDLVFGSEISSDWYVISKVFIEQGNQAQDSVKTEVALLKRFGSLDASIAYTEEIGGRFSETGLHISIARRF